MTAVVPSIHIYNKKTQLINADGMAGKVAVIGAFDSTETNPKLFNTVGEAQSEFGTDTSYNGCKVIEPLFKGASSLLCVNFTTKTGTAPNETVDKTLTTTKLTNCLAKIKGEDFDILFVAEILTDDFIPIIDSFLEDCYEMKYPAGFIGSINGANTSANVTSAGLCGEHCYGVITQSLSVNGTDYSLLESGAYYCGIIASLNVGNSMTMKQVDGVTGLNPELSFETNGDGKTLLEAGITTFKCQDRTTETYIVVNSELPNGYDLYINRVRDYVIKQFALHQFLGNRNRVATLNEIKQELDRVKDLTVGNLDLLKDINYTVAKENANCVGINIDSLLFDGIITRINVYVRVEVE